jgi:curved DNA-binding protein CbpA
MAKTHYEVLGVQRYCSAQEIKAAYRRLVMQYHPDRNSDPASNAVFIQVTEAYDVLSDGERRNSYDRSLDLAERQEKEAAVRKRTATVSAPRKAPAHQADRTTLSVDITRLSVVFSRGRYGEAEKIAKRILKVDSRQPMPYAILGDLARSRGDINEAQRMYALAAQMDPRNPLYQKRYEQLLTNASTHETKTGSKLKSQDGQSLLLLSGAFVSLLAALYVALSAEQSAFGALGVVSSWTIGLIAMLLVAGATIGACLSLGNYLDRFEFAAVNVVGRLSPVLALGCLSLLNFWAAAMVYAFVAVTQRTVDKTASRVVGGVCSLTLLFTGAAALSPAVDWFEVLLWSGNVLYVATVVGWMAADAFRRP